jgi:hypothetical protein
MSLIIGIAFLSCLLLAGALFLVCRKLVMDASLPVEDDWLQQLSPQRYRPLERLLDQREMSRLQSHPAITPKMLRSIRSRRVRIFRAYLNSLSADYGRVCKTVRLLMVQSAQDRPDLANVLVRQRFTFSLRLMMAECRLTLHALGVGGVDVAQLVAALDSMRVELNSLMVAAQPSAA